MQVLTNSLPHQRGHIIHFNDCISFACSKSRALNTEVISLAPLEKLYEKACPVCKEWYKTLTATKSNTIPLLSSTLMLPLWLNLEIQVTLGEYKDSQIKSRSIIMATNNSQEYNITKKEYPKLNRMEHLISLTQSKCLSITIQPPYTSFKIYKLEKLK